MILTTFMVLVAIVAALQLIQTRRQNKTLENLRLEIEAKDFIPTGCTVEDDEEYWQILRIETAAEVLEKYFTGDGGLPNEDELADTILRYVDALIAKLREEGR